MPSPSITSPPVPGPALVGARAISVPAPVTAAVAPAAAQPPAGPGAEPKDTPAAAPAPAPTPATDAPKAAAPDAPKPGDAPMPGPKPEELEAKRLELAQRFEELGKKDLEQVRRKREQDAREKNQRAHDESVKQKLDAHDQAHTIAKTNPLELLKLFGVTFQDVTAFALNQPPGTAEHAELTSVKQQVKELHEKQAKLEDERKAAEEAKKQSDIQTAVQNYRNRLKLGIDNSENYALLQKQGEAGIDLVQQVAKLHLAALRKQGRPEVLPDDALLLKLAEDHLEEQVSAFLTVEKIKKKFQPAPEVSPTPAAPSNGAADPATAKGIPTITQKSVAGQTLSNALQSVAAAPKFGIPTAEESKKAAAALLQWK